MQAEGKNIPLGVTVGNDGLMAAIENPLGKKVIINGFDTDTPNGGKELTERQVNFRAGLFVIVFVGAIIAAIVFSQTEPLLCLVCVGAIFFIIGMLAVIQGGGIRLDNLPAFIVPSVGALMIIIPLMMLYHRDHPESLEITRDGVITLILWCFAAVGVFLLIIPIIRHLSMMSRCSKTVTAKCIFMESRPTSHRDARGITRHTDIFSPVWQYELGEVIFVTREAVFSGNDIPAVGESREIRYDADEPSCVYRPVLRNNFIEMAIGAAFIAAGLLALYFKR